MINEWHYFTILDDYTGLDMSYWDCDEAARMMLCYLAAHDFVMSRRFADWPMSVRSQIVCSTVLCSFGML